MAADSEYIERVRGYDWDDVTGLWRDIQRCATPGWDAGKALEYLVLKGFELGGATVRWPYTVKFVDEKILEQIDGVIYAAGIAAMVECKDYSAPSSRTKRRIGADPIATLQAKLTRRPAALIGCLFASGECTEAAEQRVNFTKPATILCWTGDDIDRCVHRRNFTQTLQRKFRICVEEGKHLTKCSTQGDSQMEMRNIICPSQDSVNFLNAWLPPEISASSHFFFPSPLSDAPATARNVLATHPLQALLIRDAHTTNPVLISDLEVYAEERLMLSAPKQQFEIEVVSPTLLVMLFETPEIFTAVFGERATDFLHLMGSYDPERAIGEAGATVANIIAHLDDTTRALLRATPTARRILSRIAKLDAKPYLRDDDWDAAWYRDRPQPTRSY